MPEAVAYYDPGPYYVDPTEGGSDCLCDVEGDGTEARPYKVTYCAGHATAAKPQGSFWTPLLFPLGLLAGAALQALSTAFLRAL